MIGVRATLMHRHVMEPDAPLWVVAVVRDAGRRLVGSPSVRCVWRSVGAMASLPGGTLVRSAALAHIASGIGIVASMAIIIAVALRDRRLPVSHGIHWLDGGPFARLGFWPVLRLAGMFALLGVLEIMVGARLWRRGTTATRQAVAVNALGVPFWVGFNLPYAPPVVAVRLVLLWAAGRRRHPR